MEEKFPPEGPKGGFQAYQRTKPHFTEAFWFSKRTKRRIWYACKSGFRLVFTGLGTLVRLP